MIITAIPSPLEAARLAPIAQSCGFSPHIIGVGVRDSLAGFWPLAAQRPAAIVLLGIAGAYVQSGLQIGQVVRVDAARLGDVGARAADGSKLDATTIGASNSAEMSASIGEAPVELRKNLAVLPGVSALTVISATGTAAEAAERYAQNAPQIEEMEGALLALWCQLQQIPFYHVRAVSNWVGPRDVKSWQVDLALQNLTLWLQGKYHG